MATYIKQLLKGETESLLIIRDPFRGDVVHRIFQHFLVPHIGLDEVLKTAYILSIAVKL